MITNVHKFFKQKINWCLNISAHHKGHIYYVEYLFHNLSIHPTILGLQIEVRWNILVITVITQ